MARVEWPRILSYTLQLHVHPYCETSKLGAALKSHMRGCGYIQRVFVRVLFDDRNKSRVGTIQGNTVHKLA